MVRTGVTMRLQPRVRVLVIGAREPLFLVDAFGELPASSLLTRLRGEGF